MKSFSIFFIAILFFSGCSSAIPNWYIKSPYNSEETLYGVGEGRSEEEAKKNALNDLASRLNFEIDAMMYSQRVFKNAKLSSELKKRVDLNYHNINFFDIKISESEEVNSKYYLLIEVDREDLANQIRDDLQLLDTKIYSQIDFANESKEYKKLLSISKIIDTFQTIIYKAKILKIVDKNFELTKLKEMEERVEEIKRSVSFVININPKNNSYAKEIISLILNNGYSIDSEKKSNLVIDVMVDNYHSLQKGWINQDKNRVTYLKYSKKNWEIYKNRVRVTLKNRKKILSNQTIEAIGSSQNKKEAYRNSVTNFVKKFDLNRLIYGG